MTGSPAGHEPCTLLPWDTEFWGFPVARLNGSTLAAAAMPKVNEWCAAHGVRCLYFLAAGSCPRTLGLAHEHGFRFVDVRVELSLAAAAPRGSAATPGSAVVRPAAAADLPELRELAALSHHDTRFFKDDRFDAGRAADLYRQWIERDFARHTVLVSEAASDPGRASGYISCERDEAVGVGRIGLVAVAAEHHGCGHGTALLEAALQWFAAARLDTVRVVTQATNVAALRLYERCGFLTSAVNVWFHRWHDGTIR